MRGEVREGLEPTVRVVVIGPDDAAMEVDAVVDTGSTAHLTLPEHVIEELDLSWRNRDAVWLADGTVVESATYDASLIWHDRIVPILVHAAESKPLIGMRLLSGSRLTIDAVDDGPVTIEPLDAPTDL